MQTGEYERFISGMFGRVQPKKPVTPHQRQHLQNIDYRFQYLAQFLKYKTRLVSENPLTLLPEIVAKGIELDAESYLALIRILHAHFSYIEAGLNYDIEKGKVESSKGEGISSGVDVFAQIIADHVDILTLDAFSDEPEKMGVTAQELRGTAKDYLAKLRRVSKLLRSGEDTEPEPVKGQRKQSDLTPREIIRSFTDSRWGEGYWIRCLWLGASKTEGKVPVVGRSRYWRIEPEWATYITAIRRQSDFANRRKHDGELLLSCNKWVQGTAINTKHQRPAWPLDP
ncbi:MAG: hypothetical protein IGQ88_11805 [Gloeomargaritaceae cyanobacterium C42_A2020_066]|nr:hypothetical protein [Gloeomargaritaceae cyanobacterium C42_A2020_066]